MIVLRHALFFCMVIIIIIIIVFTFFIFIITIIIIVLMVINMLIMMSYVLCYIRIEWHSRHHVLHVGLCSQSVCQGRHVHSHL